MPLATPSGLMLIRLAIKDTRFPLVESLVGSFEPSKQLLILCVIAHLGNSAVPTTLPRPQRGPSRPRHLPATESVVLPPVGGTTMQDLAAKREKLLVEAADCELISNL